MMMKKKLLIFLFILFNICTASIFSQTVHETIQAQLILKIITFDRNFQRFSDPIKIGITSKKLLKAMQKHSDITVKGKFIKIEELENPDNIPQYNIIYIDRGWEDQYGQIAAKASENKILVFCSSFQAVEKGYGGISFRAYQGKPKIVINLTAVREQGSNFPADLLKISFLVGDKKK
jgi:hypothetical protein